MAKKKLGEVLRERGHISPEDLSKALDEQHRKVSLLGEVLLQRGLVGKENLVAALEEVTKVPYVDCRSAQIDSEVLKLVPRHIAVKHCAMPLALDGQKAVMVMAEPQSVQAIDELRFVAGKVISPRLGFRSEIMIAIETYYGGSPASAAAEGTVNAPILKHTDHAEVTFIPTGSRQSNQEALKEIQAELQSQPSPAVSAVSAAIAAAVAKDASDIHMEPQGQGLVVRLRVDGVLREITQIPLELQNSVVSRVKILADMDIAERRKPQDGRIVVRVGKKQLDLRISTLPTHLGEKVVIRLLDPSAPRLQFSDLGMLPQECKTLTHILDRPQGMLLVTGPTGSGKTTTLYAALHQLRSPSINIVTVEDPVEYMLEGTNQVQVNIKAGLTFAKSLRSILRQDPNIIMVGEIRDGETAEIALKAAQTGHLVLTTVHTNDSIAAIARLLDLQILPFLIASSVTAIMSQRLVRKLCSCREQVAPSPEYIAQLLSHGIEDPGAAMYAPVGCPTCDNSGFKGRAGVFEILMFDEQIRSSIRSGCRPEELRALARSNGMKTIQEDALDKVRAGLTTLPELLRVISFDQAVAVRCHDCSRELAPSFLFCPFCGTKRRANTVSVPVLAGHRGDSE
jgi:type IV pilus assembly protein PilB